MTNGKLLEISHLSFTYPNEKRPAVRDISFTMREGEFVVVSGSSGCGKTTLFRLIKRELAPKGEKSGQILFLGTPQEALSDRTAASEIGYVMQSPETQIVMDKVWHELAFGLENMGEPTGVIRKRVGETANYFGIQTWFHKDTATLSGGQKQLLNLASVLLLRPKLLILDEPTSQLDPIAASDFIATLKKLNQELGTAVLISEHRLEEVFPIADRAVIMADGGFLAADTPRKVAAGIRALDNGEEILRSLPGAVRIYEAAGSFEKPATESPLTVKEGSPFMATESPLTVKEGRAFLQAYVSGDAQKGCGTEGISDPDRLHAAEETKKTEKKTPALEAKGVWFRYARSLPDVLKETRLAVYEGEIFSILGGNASGKSTLLQALAGLIKPYRGKISVFGRNIKEYKGGSLYRQLLAMLPQDVQSVFVKQSVREDYAELARVLGYDKQAMEAETLRVARLLEIEELLDRHPYDLSGGEQQKAALGKLLLSKPKLLLLDEPTKGIDAAAKYRFGKLLRSLAEGGMTVLLVTHDVEFAAQFSDRCGLFFDGALSSADTPSGFFSDNTFYTTAASRISRGIFDRTVTCEEVAAAMKKPS